MLKRIYSIFNQMQSLKRVFITGSNRGLGYELVKLLSQKNPELQLHISSRKDPLELAQQWGRIVPNHRFRCYELDLTKKGSIQTVTSNLKKDKVTFDFIVANAAIRMPVDNGEVIPPFQVAHSTLQINLASTIEFTKQFVELLASNGRIIMVSSDFGALTFHSQTFQKKLTNPEISESEIFGIADSYIQAAKDQKMGDFNLSPYKVSKALLNAWTRFILPKYLKESQSIVCMHPGWCRTDMGGPNAYFTPQHGGNLIYDCFWLKQIQKDRFYNGKFCSYVQCQ